MVGAGVVGGLLLAGSGLVIVLLGFAVVGRPLEQLIEKTRRVGGGDLSGPLAISSRDEFSELATALNVMCEQLVAAAIDSIKKPMPGSPRWSSCGMPSG